jgi:Cysteine-rich CPCC
VRHRTHRPMLERTGPPRGAPGASLASNDHARVLAWPAAPDRDAMASPHLPATSPRSYPCPCCGYLSHHEPPGSYESCEICLWKDDPSQLRYPETRGGANRSSLVKAQEDFRSTGTSEPRGLLHGRDCGANDERDSGWRAWNRTTDDTERPETSVGYGKSYPSDTTRLYYWRDTYWRRRTR